MTKHFAHVVRGSGPGLLLAHGGGGSIDGNFGPLLEDLARTHTVIGADYPGTGDTPRATGPLVLDEVADELVSIAVDAGVERFTILGYSVGTAVAVRAAARHPERVTGLILTSGFAKPDNRTRLAVEVWRSLLEHEDKRLLVKFICLFANSEKALNALTPEQLESSIEWLTGNIPAGTPEHVDLVASIDTRAELGGITVPTLVIATSADTLASPALSRDLASRIPDARLVEIDSGHSIAQEAPGEWLVAIQKFLTEIG